MTLNEATRIHQRNIDKATGKELGFRERYTRYIDYLGGLDAVKPYIPFELDYLIPSTKMIACSITHRCQPGTMRRGFTAPGSMRPLHTADSGTCIASMESIQQAVQPVSVF